MAAEPFELKRVRKIAELKRQAEVEYRLALRAAVDSGHSYVEIGRAAGVTRQAVRQLVERG